MDEWGCRACGATYPEETTPCLQCASDRVTPVDDDATEDYSQDPVASGARTAGTSRHGTLRRVIAART